LNRLTALLGGALARNPRCGQSEVLGRRRPNCTPQQRFRILASAITEMVWSRAKAIVTDWCMPLPGNSG